MKHLVSILLLLLLISCDGGTDNNIGDVTPTTEDIKGTYTLNSINGSFFPTGGPAVELNGGGDNYSGKLYIDENYCAWDVTINGMRLVHAGRYEVNYSNHNMEGVISVIGSGMFASINFTAFLNRLFTNNLKFLDEGTYNGQEDWTKVNDRPFFKGAEFAEACTASFDPGLCISVVDSQTGQPISCDTSMTISNDFYPEEASNPLSVNCDDTLQICGLYERSGVYSIEVVKAGYNNYVADDIIVTANICHVNRVIIQVALEKIS